MRHGVRGVGDAVYRKSEGPRISVSVVVRNQRAELLLRNERSSANGVVFHRFVLTRAGAKFYGRAIGKLNGRAGAKLNGRAGAKLNGRAGAKLNGRARAKLNGRARAKFNGRAEANKKQNVGTLRSLR